MGTRIRRIVGATAFAGLIALAIAMGSARAQNQSPNAASPTPIAFRGAIVCEQAFGAADVLRAPLDIVERGSEVQFARPLFNLDGTRVLGSELGEGAIDASGEVHMTSIWKLGAVAARGDYSGALAATGGTLTGRQSWPGPDGLMHSRACQLAVVPLAIGAK
jgi:hypothetical protein